MCTSTSANACARKRLYWHAMAGVGAAATVLLLTAYAWYFWSSAPGWHSREGLLGRLKALPVGVAEQEIVRRAGAPRSRKDLLVSQELEKGEFGFEGSWLVQGSCKSPYPRFDQTVSVLAYDIGWGMSFDEAWVILDKNRRMISIWIAED